VRLNVLIVPDKFKGTLTSAAAATAMARGWQAARPTDTLTLLPMSDGGDGFGAVFSQLLGAKPNTLRTLDAAHRPHRAKWWWAPESKTAILESANVIGLAMLPPKQFHPFQLDTFGLGLALQAAAKKGARRCLLGIGGSATNDGGFGMARALGWQFLDSAGNPLEKWTDLQALTRIMPPGKRRWFEELLVAVDVQNPLLGMRGATRIYGPQKGIRPENRALAENCLRRLAKVVQSQLGVDYARNPGAGAAGGLGFGLPAFLGARLTPGFELFAKHSALAKHLRNADIVVTGEGRLDNSSLMGKGVGQLAQSCLDFNIPCLGLAGQTADTKKLERIFTRVAALTDLTDPAQAQTQPALWLKRLTRGCALQLNAESAPKPSTPGRSPRTAAKR